MNTRLKQWARVKWASRGQWMLGVVVLMAIVAGLTRAASTPAVVPTVALSAEPLYAAGIRAKPTLTLALSVEFPTVGAAYNDTTYNDADSSNYVGYYDSLGCYAYDKTNKYFVRSSTVPATNHDCGGSGFSGNFMNWATSSAIDILRYALTGGDRIVDASAQTVLQRAILPDGSKSPIPSFYNNSNDFPSKKITSAQAARALPAAMIAGYANLPTNGVYIANCLNQIYFGVEQNNGSCGNAGSNGILGTSAAPTTTTGSLSSSNPGIFSSTACASENSLCTLPSTTGYYKVAYGSDSAGYAVGTFPGGSVNCDNSTFGDPAYGFAKKCFVSKVAVTAPTSAGVLSSDPYFLAKVQVCDSIDAAARPGLCQQYPSGSFKPVGNLQKYSDQVRVAVFGYLIDQSTARYGGVLRSPMKYVGPKTYDSSFNLVSGANPLQEWDSTTGIFVVNPNSDSMGVSGAINYLNHFGRTQTLGLYKVDDPISELYYESVRYLQGLSPTNNSSTDSTYSAISGVTTSATDPLKDGFPVYTSWTDPVPAVNGLTSYSCIGNNILTIGDANTHYDRYIPGNSPGVNGTPSGDPLRAVRADYDEPDYYGWTKVVGAFESNHAGVTYLDSKGNSQTVSNPMTSNSALWGLENLTPQVGGDHNSYFMAGIAYWANTHDIRASGLANYSASLARPGMRVTSYFIDVNEGGADSVGQANHTTNQFYLAAKYGGFTDASTIGNPFLDASLNPTNANWWNATAPNDPKTYFLGSNGSQLISALNNVFANIAQQAGSIAGGAISSTQSQQTTYGIYQAKFNPSDWSGDIVDYPVTVNATTQAVTVGTDANATWRASSTASATGTLDSRTAPRNIVIGRTTPDGLSGAANDFNWAATDFEQSTKNALQTPPYSTGATASDPASTGQARLNYLRGDSTNEAPNGLLFRKRTHKLGDIINSGVVYKGAPDPLISDAGYAAFVSANQSRGPVVYAGANDGMLHAFDAVAGSELFAYIPSMVIPNLSALTSSNYIHASYVDSTPVVAEAYVSSVSSPSWKTVLVSGLGAGGQGVFALDVTTPTAFSANNVMWEFRDTDDADMGNVIGRPQIVKVRTSAVGATTATYRWFAAVASGVNNNTADGHASDGAPALFLLDLGKGPTDAWVSGTNYYKVKFPVADQTRANGIVGFTFTQGSAGELNTLYAGDLQGKLWKLDFSKADFSSSDSSNWALAKLSPYQDSSGNPSSMFIATNTAVSSSATTQPITSEPNWVAGPNHGYIVMFGTGKFLEQADVANTPFGIQSIYGVYDNGSSTPIGSAADPGRGYLQAGTVNSSGTATTIASFNYGRPSSASDMTVRAGWVYDLPNSTSLGERVISPPQVLDNVVVFNSIEPPLNGCAAGGSGQYVIINPLSGAAAYTHSNELSSPAQFLAVATSSNSRNSNGFQTQSTTYRGVTINSDGTSGLTTPFQTSLHTGRLSWRQIQH